MNFNKTIAAGLIIGLGVFFTWSGQTLVCRRQRSNKNRQTKQSDAPEEGCPTIRAPELQDSTSEKANQLNEMLNNIIIDDLNNMSMQTISDIIKKVTKFGKQQVARFIENGRTIRRKEINSETYVNKVSEFKLSKDNAFNVFENQVLAGLNLTNQDFEAQLDRLIQDPGNQAIYDLLMEQRDAQVADLLPIKSKLNLEKCKQILTYSMQMMDNYEKDAARLRAAGVSLNSCRLVYQLMMQDMVWEKFKIEEEQAQAAYQAYFQQLQDIILDFEQRLETVHAKIEESFNKDE